MGPRTSGTTRRSEKPVNKADENINNNNSKMQHCTFVVCVCDILNWIFYILVNFYLNLQKLHFPLKKQLVWYKKPYRVQYANIAPKMVQKDNRKNRVEQC